MSEKQVSKEIKRLEKLMVDHAKNLEFEKAAQVRDQLHMLKQQLFGAPGTDNVVPHGGEIDMAMTTDTHPSQLLSNRFCLLMSEAIPRVDFSMRCRWRTPSWRPILIARPGGRRQIDPAYLPALADDDYLPTEGRLFAAFAQPLDAVRYVLVGEGPYPRAESATGVCFMDGAVDALWSEKGLSKQVNRATSLRNFMKMLLVADGQLKPGQTSGEAMAACRCKARATDSPFIQTLTELQANLTAHGFLLLNASLVFRRMCRR